ncbi:NADPH-dependent 1-acyldihydroxyacetone phosphate reductase-like [Raphidocelis subcapitata]|uniref:NADPH-dependent 1-acyldihydroxyacetone phosphate reductase-like n=1 Tax=Raphidocelis subcapitata TaxID=307507 RepID=A0A2V0PCX2_9CHLO|nr:NADPH-dependent 1-acyldihydroxyacetone phosphate reductase-like [Raphidocelis subcapitata]|eukprot:GBF97696.1 NADPH-dependent 1-acyldihydroxyacetone phosphate reductase-like [Raphidocelis subcapitata]
MPSRGAAGSGTGSGGSGSGRSTPVALVTGCSAGGIGHALCLFLRSRGCRVFGTVRRGGAAPELEEAGVTVVGGIDVAREADCAAAVAAVLEAAGRLDILVNNAGVVALGPSCEVPMDVVRRTFEANVFGLLQMCQAAHRPMVAQGGGKIINIASLTGLQPVPLRGIYSSTKAAVVRLSDALRIELRPLGVQVACVCPGFINTRARDNARSNCAPPTGGLWGGWLAALERTMAARLARAVPVDAYAAQLGEVILRERLPRVWIGRCAGLEWLPRWLPAPLRDRALAKALAINELEPELRANAAELAASWPESSKKGS